jgi:uncharacterized glyoxalase superfamily protein PhnB
VGSIAPATAALLAAGVVLIGWHGVDLPAALYRVGLFHRVGLTLWDSQWYGGHWTLDYSVTFGPVAGVLGIRVTAVLSATVAAWAFDRVVVGTRQGVRPQELRKTLGVEILNSNPVLAVHDLAKSAAWYRDVLGCETRDPDPGNWTFCRLGAIDFMLGECPNAMPASDLGDHSYVAYLRVDDVDAFHDRAVEAGADITKPLTEEPWGMREFALRSVDGHRFTLGQSTRR